MQVYLVRHGEAEDLRVDANRKLTPRGIEDVKLLANNFKAKGFKATNIFHSELLRAKQTANILAQEENISPTEVEDLLPSSNPSVWAAKLKELNQNIMLVGHMPYMSYLVEYLLEGKLCPSFTTASMIALELKDNSYHIIWSSHATK